MNEKKKEEKPKKGGRKEEIADWGMWTEAGCGARISTRHSGHRCQIKKMSHARNLIQKKNETRCF